MIRRVVGGYDVCRSDDSSDTPASNTCNDFESEFGRSMYTAVGVSAQVMNSNVITCLELTSQRFVKLQAVDDYQNLDVDADLSQHRIDRD